MGGEVCVARFPNYVKLIKITLLFFFGSSLILVNTHILREAFAQDLANCFPGSKKPASEVVTLINNWRVSQGLPPLAPDPRLERAAQLHSEDMAAHNFCAHRGSNGSQFNNRARSQGYVSGSGGEMIGCGLSTPSELLAALASSESHRKILIESHHHIGVGLANNRWTVDVGSATDGSVCTTTNAALILSPIWFQPFYLLYEVR